jgi:hypothetical protein
MLKELIRKLMQMLRIGKKNINKLKIKNNKLFNFWKKVRELY